MATYVLVHGGFWGSWCWNQVARLLRAAGHDTYAPSLTGIGERVHLASTETTLDTHIQDVCGTLTYEELRDVVLVGWSYGGMVITGVAERMPERIAHLVFVDAWVPRDGESCSSMAGPDWTNAVLERARTEGDGWRYGIAGDPHAPRPGDPARGRSVPQPLQTLLQPLAVRNPTAAAIARTYIRCTNRQWQGAVLSDTTAAMLERCATAARDAGWGYYELPTDHGANMLGEPHILTEVLLDLAPATASPTSTATRA
jgi:pimeloyl-ACP methyl ester carboxylesterase